MSQFYEIFIIISYNNETAKEDFKFSEISKNGNTCNIINHRLIPNKSRNCCHIVTSLWTKEDRRNRNVPCPQEAQSTLTYRLVTPSFLVVRTVGALADTLSALRVRGEGHVTLNILLARVPDGIRHCEQIPPRESITRVPVNFPRSLRAGGLGLRVGKTRKI